MSKYDFGLTNMDLLVKSWDKMTADTVKSIYKTSAIDAMRDSMRITNDSLKTLTMSMGASQIVKSSMEGMTKSISEQNARMIKEFHSSIGKMASNLAREHYDMTRALYSEALISMAETAKKIQPPDYSLMLSSLAEFDFGKYENEIAENIDSLQDDFESGDEKEIVIELFRDFVEEPENFNQKFEKKLASVKSKYFIVVMFAYMIYNVFFSNIVSEWGEGVVKSITGRVRTEASSKSEMIDSLETNTVITIIGEEPHFYKVLYEVEEDNDKVQKEGYLSKKSIQLITDEEE